MTVDEVLGRLRGIKPERGYWMAFCPAHDDRKTRSLSIREGEKGARLKCFAGCDYQAIIGALGVEPMREAKPRPAVAKSAGADKRAGIESARRIWREAREPRGTIVQDYLFGRGFTGEMPSPLCAGADPAKLARAGVGLAIPTSIRFHPRLWYAAGVYLPAMVAAIEDLHGAIVGVHRTFLKPDGTGKAEVEPNKKALGRERGCAVHLTAGVSRGWFCARASRRGFRFSRRPAFTSGRRSEPRISRKSGCRVLHAKRSSRPTMTRLGSRPRARQRSHTGGAGTNRE